jgi:hypothetical protein
MPVNMGDAFPALLNYIPRRPWGQLGDAQLTGTTIAFLVRVPTALRRNLDNISTAFFV